MLTFDFSSQEADLEKSASSPTYILASRSIIRLCFHRSHRICLKPWRLLYNVFWVLMSMISLFLMSRGPRLLEPVIPEQFVSETRTQMQSIGNALLITCLILADDTCLSHKFLNS
jgi:hypothetical protein